MLRHATRRLATYPLSAPMPGIAFADAAAAAAPAGVETSTAAGGRVTVVTQGTRSDAAHVAALVPLGSRAERPGTTDAGSSAILAKLLPAAATRAQGTALSLVRNVEAAGVPSLALANSHREHVSVTASASSSNAAEIARAVAASAFSADPAAEGAGGDFAAARHAAAAEAAPEARDRASWCVDLAAEAALARPGCGNVHVPPAEVIASRTAEDVAAFHARNCLASRAVVAGVGIDHASLVAAVEAAVDGSAVASADAVSGNGVGGGAGYDGGRESHVLAPSAGAADVAVAFGAPSATDAAMFPASVLAAILGGGSAFSEGGPGKGINTHLFQAVLCQHSWSRAAQARLVPFSDAGLFVLQGTADAANAGALAEALAASARYFASGSVSDAELAMGKAMLTSNLLASYDGDAVAESLALDTLFGTGLSVAEMVARIDAVSKNEVTEQAKAIFSQAPTVTSISEGISVPSASDIAAAIAKK